MELNPKKILDIGPGYGKYGLLFREYLEIWKTIPHKSEVKIDAVEVFPEYISPVHKYIYNKVYIGNAAKVIKKIKTSYDLIVLIDVIEHMEKKDGIKLIRELKKKSEFILITTPKKHIEQTDLFSNKYEIHRSLWKRNELRKFGSIMSFKDKYDQIMLIGDKNDIHHFKNLLKINRIKGLITKIPFTVRIYKSLKGKDNEKE